MKKSSTGTVSSLGCSSLVEYMLSMCEALGSILSTTNEEAEGDSMTGQNLWQKVEKSGLKAKSINMLNHLGILLKQKVR